MTVPIHPLAAFKESFSLSTWPNTECFMVMLRGKLGSALETALMKSSNLLLPRKLPFPAPWLGSCLHSGPIVLRKSVTALFVAWVLLIHHVRHHSFLFLYRPASVQYVPLGILIILRSLLLILGGYDSELSPGLDFLSEIVYERVSLRILSQESIYFSFFPSIRAGFLWVLQS